ADEEVVLQHRLSCHDRAAPQGRLTVTLWLTDEVATLRVLQQLDHRPVDWVEHDAVGRELSQLGLEQRQTQTVNLLFTGNRYTARCRIGLRQRHDTADIGAEAVAKQQLRLLSDLQAITTACVDEALQRRRIVENLATSLEEVRQGTNRRVLQFEL